MCKKGGGVVIRMALHRYRWFYVSRIIDLIPQDKWWGVDYSAPV